MQHCCLLLTIASRKITIEQSPSAMQLNQATSSNAIRIIPSDVICELLLNNKRIIHKSILSWNASLAKPAFLVHSKLTLVLVACQAFARALMNQPPW